MEGFKQLFLVVFFISSIDFLASLGIKAIYLKTVMSSNNINFKYEKK
jgi:hypothetical protein